MRLRPPSVRIPTPTPYTFRERWRFRNDRPTNHPRTSFQTRVLGTRSQRWFYVDGVISSLVDIPPVAFLAVYAIALGATDTEVGLLSIAAGLAGFLALVPGARLAEVTSSRRWVVLAGGSGTGRLAILGMALAPFFVADTADAVWILIALSFVRSFAINVSHAAWVSLLADIVPLDLRRFYVTQRMLAITFAGAVGAPLVGFGIGLIGGVEAFQVFFILAFLLGCAAWYAYYRIEEPARPARRDRPAGSTRDMLSDRRFVRFLASLFILNVMMMVVGPFFVVYLVRDLGGSATDIGLLTTLEAAMAVGAQFALGFVVSRVPPERLFRIVMFFPATMPALWYLADSPWQTAFPYAAGGIVWAIYNVAVFNLLMEYAPSANIPRYAAVQQTFVLLAQFVGPIIGTAVVATWDIKTAMLISIVGRLVAGAVMFVPLRFVPALTPRDPQDLHAPHDTGASPA